MEFGKKWDLKKNLWQWNLLSIGMSQINAGPEHDSRSSAPKRVKEVNAASAGGGVWATLGSRCGLGAAGCHGAELLLEWGPMAAAPLLRGKKNPFLQPSTPKRGSSQAPESCGVAGAG